MVLALAAAACGGGGGGPDTGPPDEPDAALGSDAADASPVPASCNPVNQEGCEAGHKCTLVPSADGMAPPRLDCVAASGSQALDETCTPASATTPDDCAPGLVCGGLDMPRCLEFCSAVPADTCSGRQTCAVSIEIDDPVLIETFVCAPSCDPLVQDCEDPGSACYPSRNGTACAPIGAGAVPVAEGEICDYANSCEAGLGCFKIGAAFDFTCQKICNPDGISEPSCKPAQTCNQVEDEAWGICIDSA